MRRELTEFSDRIDEQFEPASPIINTESWINLLNWFSTASVQKSKAPATLPQTYVNQDGRLVSSEGLF